MQKTLSRVRLSVDYPHETVLRTVLDKIHSPECGNFSHDYAYEYTYISIYFLKRKHPTLLSLFHGDAASGKLKSTHNYNGPSKANNSL